MHELSLAYSVVELVEREVIRHGGGLVRSIELKIGTLSGVDCETFEYALSMVLEYSPFVLARVKIHSVEARAECSQCGCGYAPETLYTPCPQCGSHAARLLSGEEFRLSALTLET